MKTYLVGIGLIVVAALWRIAVAFEPSFFNVAPIAALAFCSAAFFATRPAWLVPLVALTVSDVWLNAYHASEFGYTWSVWEMAIRAAALLAAAGIGRYVAGRRSFGTVLGGVLASSLVFYILTNSLMWLTDPFYAKSVAGWVQALTIGHPQYPSTLWFFRNTLIGDLGFTAVFAAAMAFAHRREKARASSAA